MDNKELLEYISNIAQCSEDIDNDLNEVVEDIDANISNITTQASNDTYSNFLKKIMSETNDKEEDTDGFEYYCKDDNPTEQKKDVEPNIINGD